MNYFIAIEGVIGVGKTTLARRLQSYFANATLLLEVFEENPFLSHFYQDRERYAFQTQLFFLLSRYHQQNRAVPEALKRGPLISDYTFAKDELFAWLNLKDDELAMYGRVHAALSEKIPKPSLIVYLKAAHEVVMRRIALRDRPYERDMDPNYIRELAAAYEAWLANQHDAPVLTIDVSELDFLAGADDLAYVVDQVKGALAQLPTAVSPSASSFTAARPSDTDTQPTTATLLLNYLQLMQQVGGLAGELARISQQAYEPEDGRFSASTHAQLIAANRPALQRELTSLWQNTLRLAKSAGVELGDDEL